MREMYASGTVSFCHLTEHEVYDGKTTGKFSITVMLDDKSAEALSDAGVKVGEYKGQPKRKFTTTFEDIKIFNPDLSEWKKGDSGRYEREIPRGSEVNILAKVTEEPYKDYGCSAYVDKVHVLKEASAEVPTGFEAVEQPDLEVEQEEDIPF